MHCSSNASSLCTTFQEVPVALTTLHDMAVLNGAWPFGRIYISLHEMWPARLVRSFCILQVRGSVGLVRMASGGTDRALNRLAQEKSPYFKPCGLV